jgi:hypothetical protein
MTEARMDARIDPRRRAAVGEPRPQINPAAPALLAAIASGESIDQTLFWLLVAGLAWCPFWFGSNDLIAWGINAIIFPGITALYEASLLARSERHPVGIRQIGTPAALFGAVVAFVLVQNYTGAPPGMQHPIWQMTADTLETDVAGSMSVNRDLTTLALLRLVTAASAFWLSLQLTRNARRAYLLLNSIAVIAAVYALYGLIAFAVTPGYVLWLPTMFSKGYVTSTFINHNLMPAWH